MLRSGIAGLFGKCIVNVSGNYQAVVQRDYTILHFSQKCLHLLIFLIILVYFQSFGLWAFWWLCSSISL